MAAALVTLHSDLKTVSHVNTSGTRTEKDLSGTHGVNFSVDGSGDVTATEATSAPSGNVEATIELTGMGWSLTYHDDGTNQVLRLVGVDSVEMGIKVDTRTIDIGSNDYNIKFAGNKLEVRKV